MILHCGINDLMNTSSSPQQISEELKNVATIIKQQSPSCSIYISGVTHQAKYPNLDVNVQQLNDILYNICESNSFHFIDNSNITVDDLNSSGLHLTLIHMGFFRATIYGGGGWIPPPLEKSTFPMSYGNESWHTHRTMYYQQFGKFGRFPRLL